MNFREHAKRTCVFIPLLKKFKKITTYASASIVRKVYGVCLKNLKIRLNKT